MESETVYVIVDPDNKRICDPTEDEQTAWIMAIGSLSRKPHFKRAGYHCVEVTVTLNEERHDKD